MCTTSSLPEHLSKGQGHFRYFHVFTIMNNAVMNTGVHISLRRNVFRYKFYFFKEENYKEIAFTIIDAKNSLQNIGKLNPATH